MRIVKPILILILALFAFQAGLAGEVKVKEIRVSLFNKQVTGFHMVFDRNIKVAKGAIVKFVERVRGAKGFEFENTIIFENINYPAITKNKEISLYYLLHELPGNYTEVTVVAMYDFKQSVNTRDFPDLSLKMLADLSELVRRITGENTRFHDVLFDGRSAEEIAEKTPIKPYGEDAIEHFEEEEVENNNVLIRENPFADPKMWSEGQDSSLMARLLEQAKNLEAKEKRLNERVSLLEKEKSAFENEKKAQSALVKENRALRDSVRILMTLLPLDKSSELFADDVSLSYSEDGKTKDLEEKLKQANLNLFKTNRSLDSVLGLMKANQLELLSIRTDKSRLERELRDMRADATQIKADYFQLKTTVLNPAVPLDPDAAPADIINAYNLTLARNKLLVERVVSLEKETENLKKGQIELLAQRLEGEEARRLTFLVDSIKGLNERLKKAEKNPLLEGSSETAISPEEYARLKENNKVLSMKTADLGIEIQRVSAERAEANKKLVTSLAAMKELQAASESMLAKLEDYQRVAKDLEGHLGDLKKETTITGQKMIALQDSLQFERKQNSQLTGWLEEYKKGTKADPAQLDSLRALAAATLDKNKQQDISLKKLIAEKDSLIALTIPNEDMLREILKQKSEIVKEKAEFEKNQRQLSDREKLISQRESNLDRQQKDVARREKRYQDLLDKEEKLLKLEQRLREAGVGEILDNFKNGNSNPGTLGKESNSFQLGKKTITEKGKSLDVYAISSGLIQRSAEQKVASFMINQGFLHDQKSPDLVYDNIIVYNLAEAPLVIVFRFEPEGTGTLILVSFERWGGDYILPGSDSEIDQKARKFLNQMMEFGSK